MARLDNRTPDPVLLCAYREGDLKAWDLLVDRYEGLVLSVPRRMGLSASDSEDIAQNAFIALLNNLDRLRDENRIAAWLATTARREAWLFLRRKQTSADPVEKSAMLEAVPETAAEALPEAAILELEEQHLVRTALTQLPERCHTLLTLLYVSDPPLPYAEVAEQLKLPLGSIGPQRARCLEHLRKILVKSGF